MDENGNESHTGRNILIILLVVLIAFGIGGYITYQQNQDFKKAVTALWAKSTPTPTTTATVAFAPASTEGTPYVANVKTTSGDKTVSATMTSDGQGNVNYAYQAADGNISLTYTPDAYYLCKGADKCLKYVTTQQAASGVDPSTYEFDGTKLAELKNTAAYKGQQTCPSPATGTCDVWSVTSASGGATTTMYVNTENKRIVRTTTATGTTNSEVTYDYKNATVTIPTNYTTIPTSSATPTPTPTQ